MAYPSLEQYNEALQAPHRVLLDPQLKHGTLKTTGLGLPLALCGGFALTYTMTVGAQRFALRCFHKESRELEHRYQAISARLKQLNSPYFLPFEFIPKGIRIQGSDYPIVKMAWASGRTLAEFLEAEHTNKAALQRLRSALSVLASYLEQNDIAHGDIQPENVMVSGDGSTVQLIDYDGMFVSALQGAQATELGQINFQHPQRAAANFGPTLDRFSFLTLDVALQALIASSGLWKSSRSEPSAVVFRRNDFLDPSQSAVFQQAVAVPGVKSHVENLAKVALGSFAAIPCLTDFLQGKGVPAGSIHVRPSAQILAYQSPYEVCDATNYSQVLKMVGNRIELVGRIHSVKKGFAKNRKPYVFVNFSDWRGHAVKLAIWVDGMDAIRPNVPDESWVGRWVSVTGLVDPPFNNTVRSGSYTHLSITITAPGQIQSITEKDAKFRLGTAGRPAGPAAQPTSSRNANILQGMGGRSPSVSQPPSISPPPAVPRSRNQSVLSGMQRQVPPSPPSTPTRHPTPQHTSSTSSSSNGGCLPLIIGAVILFGFLRACAG